MASTPLPRHLERAGRKLWRDITSKYELRTDELRVLEEACRETDLIERLDAELRESPLVVKGSMGQPTASPLVTEVRQHRNVLARLLASLKLPDEQGGSQQAPQSVQSRQAAISRWGRRTA